MIDRVINLRLLAHPVNWLIVWTVLIFAGLAWAQIHTVVHSLPDLGDTT